MMYHHGRKQSRKTIPYADTDTRHKSPKFSYRVPTLVGNWPQISAELDQAHTFTTSKLVA